MTLDGSALALEPAPRSVQRARRWVAEVCRSAGRADLVESAEAGTSELVTNALLHAPGPIDLRVSGTAEHLRIEVHDVSPVPPRPQPAQRRPDPDASGPDDLDALLASLDDSLGDSLSTVGRGLHIVATSAHAWGAEITGDGKVVWFEPAPELREDLSEAELAGAVYATGEAAAGAGAETRGRAGADLVGVRLLGVPVDRLAAFRRHHLELRRELRLLALAHAADYPQAERLSGLFADFETDFGPAVSGPAVMAALRSGQRYADLALRVPVTAPSSFDVMLRLLDLADEFCRAARLLTLARGAEDVAFAHWFLGELGTQATGGAATPWGVTGPDARYWSP